MRNPTNGTAHGRGWTRCPPHVVLFAACLTAVGLVLVLGVPGWVPNRQPPMQTVALSPLQLDALTAAGVQPNNTVLSAGGNSSATKEHGTALARLLGLDRLHSVVNAAEGGGGGGGSSKSSSSSGIAESTGRQEADAVPSEERSSGGLEEAAEKDDEAKKKEHKAARKAAETCECGGPEAQAVAEADKKWGDQYFAMCLAVRDQSRDIREWVGHHKSVGAGKIYLVDSGSNPPLNTTIQDHIDSGLVDYIYWEPDFGNDTTRAHPQLEIYKMCLRNFSERHQFIGFVDSDEFLILKGETKSVPALLKHMQAFEPIGALAVNWVVFGSSGHITRPDGGVLQSYTKCLSETNNHTVHIKSIVNTEYADKPDGPHHFLYNRGAYAINERFQRVDGPTSNSVSIDKIAIHHYVLKSLEEYKEKAARGSGMGNHKPLSFFTGIDDISVHNCTAAVGLGPYD